MAINTLSSGLGNRTAISQDTPVKPKDGTPEGEAAGAKDAFYHPLNLQAYSDLLNYGRNVSRQAGQWLAAHQTEIAEAIANAPQPQEDEGWGIGSYALAGGGLLTGGFLLSNPVTAIPTVLFGAATVTTAGTGTAAAVVIPACTPDSTTEVSPDAVDSDGASDEGPVNEDPDPVPGDSDGIGTVSSLGQGDCTNPVDLMSIGLGDFLCVSGDGPVDGSVIMELSDNTGPYDTILLPELLSGTGGNPDVSIRLNSAVVIGDEVMAAFSPSDEDFEGTPGASNVAGGLYRTDLAGSTPSIVQFEPIPAPTELGVEVYNPNNENSQTILGEIIPNGTVAMAQIGNTNQFVVLNENRVWDTATYDIAYAPATVQIYNLEGGEPVAASDPNILLGKYQPKAMKILPDNSILILTRSGGGNGDNGSSLVRLTISNGQLVPGGEIPLSDVSGSFDAFEGKNDNLAIYAENGATYALVGDTSGSGEVAKVNISTGEVEYIGVFNNSNKMAAIEIHDSDAGQQAIVMSENKAESLELVEGTVSGSPASMGGEAIRVSAIYGNEVIVVLEDGSYKKISVNNPVVPEGSDDSTG